MNRQTSNTTHNDQRAQLLIAAFTRSIPTSNLGALHKRTHQLIDGPSFAPKTPQIDDRMTRGPTPRAKLSLMGHGLVEVEVTE
ncbi:hypothetical protein VFPPC_15677 [Pochonia chlamydosporia 170]|uniref:Uncharacterized protein n=1 Tax=Pochonia chlamydosporia 170 TaxID=1380566 RepID=A0A179G1G8_METCM|nr:hypothetical protein VFPPC_15677 [Pochonia chlamydosporia 170]OAQ71290.1 hypothetical protein VFPPC_15677 [Pochonia chlamydosporia 170]